MTSQRRRRLSAPRQANLSLTDFTGDSHEVRELELTRGPGAKGVALAIVCKHKEDGGVGLLDVEAESAAVLEGLLELPVETRRALYILITGEFSEAFNAAPKKEPKSHQWPPKPRRPQ